MTTPAKKVIHLSHFVDRFRRCLQVGNPVTVKLAYRELVNELPRLSPMDLANVTKVAFAIKPQHKLDQLEVVKAVLSECERRKWSKFSSTDLAVMTTSIAKMRFHDLLNSLSERLLNSIPEMRTTDLCVTLWAITRLAKNPTHIHSLIQEGLTSFLAQNKLRLRQLNNVNITQLIFVLARTRDIFPKLVGVDQVVSFLLTLLTEKERLHTFANEAIPFNTYALVEIIEGLENRPEEEVLSALFAAIRSELDRRIDLKPSEVIDTFRALGRVGKVDRQMVDELLIPVLTEAELTPHRVRGVTNVLKAVGYTDADEILGKLAK